MMGGEDEGRMMGGEDDGRGGDGRITTDSPQIQKMNLH